MTSLCVTSINDFINYCDEVVDTIRSLNDAPNPFFSRQIGDVKITAEGAIQKIKSLKGLAENLNANVKIANIFTGDLHSKKLTDTDYSNSIVELRVLTNPELLRKKVKTKMRQWRDEDDKPASGRRHNDHYKLVHIEEEFDCLNSETRHLRKLLELGDKVIKKTDSHQDHCEFDRSLGCVIDLYQSELGLIKRTGMTEGIPFANQKIAEYRECFRYRSSSQLRQSSNGFNAEAVEVKMDKSEKVDSSKPVYFDFNEKEIKREEKSVKIIRIRKKGNDETIPIFLNHLEGKLLEYLIRHPHIRRLHWLLYYYIGQKVDPKNPVEVFGRTVTEMIGILQDNRIAICEYKKQRGSNSWLINHTKIPYESNIDDAKRYLKAANLFWRDKDYKSAYENLKIALGKDKKCVEACCLTLKLISERHSLLNKQNQDIEKVIKKIARVIDDEKTKLDYLLENINRLAKIKRFKLRGLEIKILLADFAKYTTEIERGLIRADALLDALEKGFFEGFIESPHEIEIKRLKKIIEKFYRCLNVKGNEKTKNSLLKIFQHYIVRESINDVIDEFDVDIGNSDSDEIKTKVQSALFSLLVDKMINWKDYETFENVKINIKKMIRRRMREDEKSKNILIENYQTVSEEKYNTFFNTEPEENFYTKMVDELNK